MYFIRKLTMDCFGDFYYLYILMIKIKYGRMTQDGRQWGKSFFMAETIFRSKLGE